MLIFKHWSLRDAVGGVLVNLVWLGLALLRRLAIRTVPVARIIFLNFFSSVRELLENLKPHFGYTVQDILLAFQNCVGIFFRNLLEVQDYESFKRYALSVRKKYLTFPNLQFIIICFFFA